MRNIRNTRSALFVIALLLGGCKGTLFPDMDFSKSECGAASSKAASARPSTSEERSEAAGLPPGTI